ncbi:alpha/beta fold hydrolase [Stieleria mannarensis]|uniref:alpha/beta fold hydrolase n=1 Tax=Stieleria mannarensis TaxID=2755585 RepID=UPI00160226FB|nr:alpha/beta hydrolase [Rhodopirellula sp. JC639]
MSIDRCERVSRRVLLAAIPSLWFCDPANGQSNLCITERLVLPDSRRLAFRRYGDPNGVPVLYFHGTPSCRLEAQLLDSIAWKRGVCLVAVDRPGMGLSTFCSFDQQSFAADVKALIHHLRLPSPHCRIGILAMSGGTSYALACAQALSKDISAVGILSPRTPFAPGVPVTGLDKQLQSATRFPRLAGLFLSRQVRLAKRGAPRAGQKQLDSFGTLDQQFVSCHSAVFRQILVESTRGGTAGVRIDMNNIIWPCGVCLQRIKTPVAIWRGDSDLTSPPATSQFLGRYLANSVSFTIANEGHFTLMRSAAGQALDWLVHRTS